MNRTIALALALAIVASPAFAQQPPRMSGAMQSRASGRAAMLRALTNAHRNLLATIAGQLATSENPDIDGAAQRLDSVLTAAEKQSIMSTVKSMSRPGQPQPRSAGDALLHISMQFMAPPQPPGGPPQ